MEKQKMGLLMKFTTAAKAVIFDADRMRELLPMMDSKAGALQAVQAVVGAIEQKKPIPPDIKPLLGANAYMLMVDLARDITGAQPDPEIIKDVVGQILITMSQGGQPQGQMVAQGQPQGMPPQGAQPPQGIMQKAMA